MTVVFILLFALAATAAAFFAVRFALLRAAIRRADEELREINTNITENHVLRLAVPDKRLGAFLDTVNQNLACVRRERNEYAARERSFRSQIEAVSHDLRTPLTVIIGYLKLSDGERDGTRDVVLRRAQSMQKLIAAFYEYSRIIAGDYTLSPAAVDMCRLVRETFADNCVIFEEKGLAAEAHFPDAPATVYADGAALERVTVNLLQNAARYAENFFMLSFFVRDGQAVAVFENDAAGLDESDLPRLFDRFYTADGSRNAGGTGLGLTIARDLVRQMGGELTAALHERADGKTVAFTLSFPLYGA